MFPIYMLVLSAFTAAFGLYIWSFTRKYGDNQSDPRRYEQARIYREKGLAKQMATGAVIVLLIALLDIFFP